MPKTSAWWVAVIIAGVLPAVADITHFFAYLGGLVLGIIVMRQITVRSMERILRGESSPSRATRRST